MQARTTIQRAIESRGLLFLGIVGGEASADYEAYKDWISAGKQAGMRFMEAHEDSRRNVSHVLPNTRSVVSFALRYDLGDNWPSQDGPRIAQYARFRDYHKSLRRLGDEIILELQSEFSEARFRTVVDTAPVFERAMATQTQRGFIGKHTCYIHPDEGSFLLLGEILTTLDVAKDERTPIDPNTHGKDGGCGSCTECQVACPTGALDTAYVLDARKCLAYWTIEHRGPIPEIFWPWLGKYYFGCDICQLVCPYTLRNRKSTDVARLEVREFPSLYEVAVMDDVKYQKYFGGTPMTRAKRNGLRRNALIAMTVTQDPQLRDAMQICERDNESPIQETLDQIESYFAGASTREESSERFAARTCEK